MSWRSGDGQPFSRWTPSGSVGQMRSRTAHPPQESPAVGNAMRDGAAVRLIGLHKSFGRIEAVGGVDLTIAPGEVVAVLGPNGAGKSTTIDLILGLTEPDGGSVAVFGSDPTTAVR